MSDKKRLGKGLGALIPEAMASSAETSEISLERIKPNPFQPRRTFDELKLKELAESIKKHGILQAVVVSPEGDGYILIAGERRCRAARMAGLNTIPALVRSFDHSTMLEIALIENLQREDLNPIEEALAYRKLMQDYSYTQEELAGRIGRSRPSIANSIRLLSLPESIVESLASGTITPGQARPILAIDDQEIQLDVAKRIIENGMSSREAERIAAQIASKKTEKKLPGIREKQAPDPIHTELQLQMQRNLGTKVMIKHGKNGGIIEIHYYSNEDLENLITKLLPEGIG